MAHDAASNDPALTTEDCRYCWMCRHVCPVGHVTKRETLTPHAWALLIASVRRGTMTWNAETADVLYQCADCGMCRTHCVTDRPLPEAIVLARAEVAAAGLAPKSAYAWRDAASARETSPRAAAPLASDAALFVGQSIGDDTLSLAAVGTLLATSGVRVTPIGEGLGTGVVASALGFADLARAEAQAVVDLVTQSGASRVIVMSVSDRYAFEHVYGARLGIAWPDGVAVTEVTTVLADALAEGRLTFRSSTEGPAYAYHDPCNSPRLTRDPQAPRALLAAALGDGGARRLFWRENRAHPCGSVGALAHTHPDLAAQLSDARLADAAAVGAAVLVTDDPACLHHLQSRSASGVSVAGLYQLLAGQLAS